jgi:SAM-dependent methyltransferase
MTKSHASMSDVKPTDKKVPIQERSVPVGHFVVVNGYHVNRESLKTRFIEGGYSIHETPHFLLFIRAQAPSTIVVHWFAPEALNADVHHYLVQELKPFGIFTCSQHFGEVLSGIVSSLFPDDARRAWRYYGANTLQRYLTFLATAYTPPLPDYATIGMFATLYQRVCELRTGDTFLDAGCASGFLPLLVAERIPFLQEVVGVDIDQDAFNVARELAREHGLLNVCYVQADLLDTGFTHVGRFDTVVALHVLEHLSEDDMYRALSHLLQITTERLILAVPYEKDVPEVSYGHLQLFTREKLEAVGAWCVQQLEGAGKIWLEDCVGGLLLIQRNI